ncbi:hypothetical protein FEE95_04785 [Maribacter algarum]|uniref:DUF4251 domain-containing protein n=1 Tax=Maribacter algarum (ex Zhang et al. 2020) TaxID=2578118 RepID=A0A5S3PUR8_9FLAO|nr:hypothetical protein [Maribacter algarum]TMM58751.1 hypothetical protein FEE95_04785 [Maribacter algarum]
MKNILKFSTGVLLFFSLISCFGEAKEKLNKAKEGVSNATTFVKEAKKVEGRIEELKNATPLTNEQLKKWLPKNLGDLVRTGFKVGQAGMYQVNSVEGTYKKTDSKQIFNVMLIDGAGPTGSMMTAGYGMFGNMEMETEDEYKHLQTVTVDGIKAQQTYKKKANNTQLMFAYQERFLITVNGTSMNVEETWEFTRKLDLEALVKFAE